MGNVKRGGIFILKPLKTYLSAPGSSPNLPIFSTNKKRYYINAAHQSPGMPLHHVQAPVQKTPPLVSKIISLCFFRVNLI